MEDCNAESKVTDGLQYNTSVINVLPYQWTFPEGCTGMKHKVGHWDILLGVQWCMESGG